MGGARDIGGWGNRNIGGRGNRDKWVGLWTLGGGTVIGQFDSCAYTWKGTTVVFGPCIQVYSGTSIMRSPSGQPFLAEI